MNLTLYPADSASALAFVTFPQPALGAAYQASVNLILKNETEMSAQKLRLGFDQVGSLDLEPYLSGSADGAPFTFAGGLVALPDLAAGAAINLTLTVDIPADKVLESDGDGVNVLAKAVAGLKVSFYTAE